MLWRSVAGFANFFRSFMSRLLRPLLSTVTT
uniref:Uncharacterized protein n=1 Tax=Setaria viridis TaxID=4556 RepID=A0A4U6VFK9_SETVI|nr:hypothetical protein SEVIR_3G162366v2 [Setaria viridis]